jgi:3-hydroxyacyl-CoA dehydrogenase
MSDGETDRGLLDTLLTVLPEFGVSKGPRDLVQSYVDAGKLGLKTGEGFYSYRGD